MTTSYVVNQVTVTDQDLKTRSSTTDALGRLSVVTENPGGSPTYDTSYGYDALGNLTGVTQGTQTRTFTYDMLSRLKTAKNPEQVNTSEVQVATAYDYDAASNLLTKTNPNSSTVTFTYDGLNRVLTKALSGGPSFTFAYDTGTNRKGRLVSVTTANGDGNFYDSYDSVGRVTSSHQVTDGNTYSFPSYVFDLAGHMTSETYPSGRIVATAYDDAGRISGVTGQVQQTTKTYVDTFSYTANGAVSAMKFGTDTSSPRWEHTSFNSRLQPTLIGVGTNGTTDSTVLKLDYLYGSTDARNNGNMRQQKISIGATVFTQDYTYDALNRLQTANETVSSQTSWSQTYGYDRWGNRWVSGNMNFPLNTAMTPQSQSQIDPLTNRIIPAQMPSAGFSYDMSGNLDGDPTTGAHHIAYDAENHQTSYNSGAATYVYDGEGHRVKKVVVGNPSVTTIYVYNAASQLIAEYKDQATGGSGGTQFVASDHLGSTRALMNTSGTATARYDYLPFGEEIPSSLGGRSGIAGYNPTATINKKFTQTERDAESQLDYFLARYYSSAQGRFTGADPENAGADRSDPQSWNGYAYGRNNPLLYVDPSGTDYMLFGPDGKILYIWDSAFEGNNTDFEIVSGDGTNLTVVYQGETYTGSFVEGSKQENRTPEFDFSVFDFQQHMERVQEYERRPFLNHLHGDSARPNPKDSTKFFKKADRSTSESQAPRKLPEPRFKTDAEAAAKAKELGFNKIGERSHGQAVFKKGNTYITRDADGHTGGAWKVGNSVEDLGSKSTRLGTYDENLTRIAN